MKMQKKIFYTFLLVIAIPTVAFLILILEISTRTIERRTVSASELVVKESVKRIDTLLNNYRKASMQIYYNQNIIDQLDTHISNGSDLEDEIPMIEQILGGIVNADKYLMSAVLRSGNSLVVRGSSVLRLEEYLDENRNGCLIVPGQIHWIPSQEIKTVFGLDSFYFGAMRLIRKNNNEIGELLFLIREEFFDDIYAGAIPENSGMDLVIDPDGMIISSPDESQIGKRTGDSRLTGIIKGNEGNSGYIASAFRGNKSYLIFARSEESGWYFIREMEERVVLQAIIKLRQSILAIIILFCSFLIFLSYHFSRGLSRPVNNLVKYIDGIGSDNLEIPPPDKKTEGDEISKLHERLYAMSSRIENLIDEVAQNERLKNQAELKALRNHISPHFIYNALDTIRWMAVINRQDNIREMVSALDKLMRYAADDEKALITLYEEIEIIREYILIQKMRYTDIELKTDIPEESGNLLINKFIIQTIVENSIVHGFRDYRNTGTITISASVFDSLLQLVVEDDGRGFNASERQYDPNLHTGLNSVDQRLKLNYGKDFGVEITSVPGHGTRAVIQLPVSRR